MINNLHWYSEARVRLLDLRHNSVLGGVVSLVLALPPSALSAVQPLLPGRPAAS
jgi:hypothetical protein